MQRLALLYAPLFLRTISRVTGDSIAVLLGDPVKFPATEKCQQEKAELHLRRGDDNVKLVARYEDGAWKPGAGYEDRVPPGASVTLNSSNMNDQGLYEYPESCRTEGTQLDVLVFHALETEERKAVTLQCHFITAGNRVESVWWEKDGQHVIQYDFSTSQTEPGPGYKGRVSLTHGDPESTGDFSLILEMPLHEDRGDYLCRARVNGVKAWGSPAATRLKVNKAGPDQTITTAAPPTVCASQGAPEPRGMETWTAVLITFVLTALVTLVLTLACLHLKRIHSMMFRGRCDGQQRAPSSSSSQANGFLL